MPWFLPVTPWNVPSFPRMLIGLKSKSASVWDHLFSSFSTYHGPPKPTFLEVFMVNNLVFRWPKPLFFMVLGAQGILYTSQTWIVRAFLGDTSLTKSTTQFARFNLTHPLVVVSRNSVFHQTVTLPSHQFLAHESLKKLGFACLKCLVHQVPNILSQNGGEWKIGDESHGIPIRKKIHQTYHQIQVRGW